MEKHRFLQPALPVYCQQMWSNIKIYPLAVLRLWWSRKQCKNKINEKEGNWSRRWSTRQILINRNSVTNKSRNLEIIINFKYVIDISGQKKKNEKENYEKVDPYNYILLKQNKPLLWFNY